MSASCSQLHIQIIYDYFPVKSQKDNQHISLLVNNEDTSSE